MIITTTKIEGLIVIDPKVYHDSRGYFYELYNKDKFIKNGIDIDFVQDNRSSSTKNILRGLHFQKNKPQGKLVTVTKGSVFDVAVDLRPNSKTFGEYDSIILSEDNKKMFYIPPGFAHGFCVLTDLADFFYKCTDFYSPDDESGIIWNDPTLSIKWPIDEPILSDKDNSLPQFEVVKNMILGGYKNA